MRLALLLLAVIGLGAHAAEVSPADQIGHEDPFAGFKFPRVISGYTFQTKVQYPRVGLGYGVSYVDRIGTTATIIIYDMNETAIADGTTGPGVLKQFEELDATIAQFAQQTGHRGVEKAANVEPLSKAWLQANHVLIRADGRRSFTYSFLRAQNGKYVKIRVTAASNAIYARLPLFLLGVSRAIGMMSGQGKPTEHLPPAGGGLKPR
jgi:hypothetical protein